MTELITGSVGSGKGTYIIEKIREQLEKKKRMFLIVPEQEAVIWERRICAELPPMNALYLQVLSFKRLANEVFRTVGGISSDFSSKGKRLLLMWSAVLSVSEQLSVYGGDEGFEDKYASLMLDVVDELKRNRIGAKDLSEASKRLSEEEEGALAKKLSDISLIYGAYSAICRETNGKDPGDALEELASVLHGSDFFVGSTVFIDSFYSLTPAELEVLYCILKSADDTFITFTFDPEAKTVHFEHVKRYFEDVKYRCQVAKSDFKEVRLNGNRRTEREDLKYLSEALWDFSAKPFEGRSDGIRIIGCHDRYEESRAAGALIERAVSKGARYSQIAVVAKDIDRLRGIIDRQLDALGIPYHMARRSGLKNTPEVKLAVSLLNCVGKGYRREDAVACLKTGLCPVTDDESAAFEEYVDTWNIRGKKAFLSDDGWSMNPLGYTAKMTERSKLELRDANRVRGVLSGAFKKLTAVFDGGTATVRDICRALYEVFDRWDVFSSSVRDAELLRLSGRDSDAAMEEKVFELIVSVFDVMEQTVGDVRLDACRFARLFFAVASTFDIGAIPAGIDMVTLGSATGVRLDGIKHVITVGCVEGEFPASKERRGVFSDADIEALEKVDVRFLDADDMNEELFRFWRTVSCSSESVTLTVPRTDGENVLFPSVAVRRIKKLFGTAEEEFSDIAEKEGVFSKRSAESLAPYLEVGTALGAIRRIADEDGDIDIPKKQECSLCADGDRVSKGCADALWGGGMSLTQSRIDKFSSCRFAFYMSYVLGLEEQRRANVSAADSGNFIHKVLEVYFGSVKSRDELPDGEGMRRRISEITEDYARDSMGSANITPRQRFLLGRLERSAVMLTDLISEEFRQSGFFPFAFEMPFNGKEGNPDPPRFETEDGTPVTLYGVIDRLDTLRTEDAVYVRVVDYKTGTKKFDLKKIEKGKDLQLLIYLFALCNSEKADFKERIAPGGRALLPAGAMYFSAPPDSAKSDCYTDPECGTDIAKKNVLRSGIFLDDEKVLRAMDSGLSGKFIPKYKAGAPSFAKLERFGTLSGEIESIVVSIADSIKGGDCGSIPAETGQNGTCEYCKMKPICRHIEGMGGESDE